MRRRQVTTTTFRSEDERSRMVEQVFKCIAKYEDVGASGSEVSDELLLSMTDVMEYIWTLESQGKIEKTKILRPWKYNVSRDLVDLRRVWVAKEL
jgi:hypothetical protein